MKKPNQKILNINNSKNQQKKNLRNKKAHQMRQPKLQNFKMKVGDFVNLFSGNDH